MAIALGIVLFTGWRILVPSQSADTVRPEVISDSLEITPVSDTPATLDDAAAVKPAEPAATEQIPDEPTKPKPLETKRQPPPTKPASSVTTDVSTPPSETPTASQVGLLTVSSIPRSKVILDGQYVRYAPVFQYEVPPGVHTVTLVTDDGRRTHFKVDIVAGKEWSRVWHFDNKDWVGK